MKIEKDNIYNRYYRFFSPTLKQKKPDCVIRSLYIVLKQPYDQVEQMLGNIGWADLLTNNGFQRVEVPVEYNKERKTVLDIVQSVQYDDLVVCQGADHLVPIIRKKYVDDRNCYNMRVYAYYIKKDIN